MNRPTIRTSLSLALLSVILAGCAGPAIPRSGGQTGKIPPRPVVTTPTPAPVVRPVQHNMLIGQSADALSRSMGRPRLDVTEGAGRKMQFVGAACVMDVYIYPPSNGAAPVATHVDARSPDGRDADINRCAQSLQRR